ncbi:enoyl-CoA hydratase/carnithine racemase [Friedmanniella endophytica]|uniref:enoyl-CoA hydratase n=1 Tax=Microlunatus kandeliicorticis TaxID=1759536 RepID=A0A7W3IUI1_9ACTN|nr:enoyl-CoA hydratase-related protein [Microlunatus kandeliicorticis]MBA8795499.1 enoyl-CoA hydratase/carnithine racemase [Microlunatus kandeliicorticis]
MTQTSGSGGDEVVRLEVADGVATIRVDKPRMNALDADIQHRLGEAARACDARDDVAAVVITGGPQVFAAGADIKEMAGLDHAAMATRSARLQADFAAVARIGKPVVAAVNGYALGGGCELALCADARIAADDAVFGQPEIKLGLIPGAGGTQRLARLVGPARAKELIFTGRFVDAAEALALGLVDQVVPAAEVAERARAWAARFVGGPALALRAAKACVDTGLGLPLEVGLDLEQRQFAALFGTEDARAGTAAFVAKTEPRFTGR